MAGGKRRVRIRGVLSVCLNAALNTVAADDDEREQARQMLDALAEFASEHGTDRPTGATRRAARSAAWLDQKWAELLSDLERIKNIVETRGRIASGDSDFVKSILAIVATELMTREHTRIAAEIERMQLYEDEETNR